MINFHLKQLSNHKNVLSFSISSAQLKLIYLLIALVCFFSLEASSAPIEKNILLKDNHAIHKKNNDTLLLISNSEIQKGNSEASASDVTFRDLEVAMGLFLKALKNRDTEAFLHLFSKSKPWIYIGTITDPHQVSLVEYAELAEDLRNRSGWYEILFDAGGDDCFRDYVMISEDKPWNRRSETTFFPPDIDPDSLVYVKWKSENDKWII